MGVVNLFFYWDTLRPKENIENIGRPRKIAHKFFINIEAV